MIGERVQRLGADSDRVTLADDLLQLMRRHGQPIGAYELIALLKARRGKRPNIYKTLNALAARGKIVRLASLRRYWALPEALPKPALLLACRVCGRVELTSSEPVRLGLSRKRGEQRLEAVSIEIPGRCRDCPDPTPHPPRNERSERRPRASFAPSSARFDAHADAKTEKEN